MKHVSCHEVMGVLGELVLGKSPHDVDDRARLYQDEEQAICHLEQAIQALSTIPIRNARSSKSPRLNSVIAPI